MYNFLLASLSSEDWEELLDGLKANRCVPFIGAGASSPWFPLAGEIAQKWANDHGYPLKDSRNLSRIAQFLAIKTDNDMYPKNILSRKVKQVQPPDFRLEELKHTTYSVLADFNLPIYITTNYDKFMEAALKSSGKDPVTEFCRWNRLGDAAGIASIFDEAQYVPTSYRPLVYHLHGVFDKPQSMVLSEDDYIDFMVNLSNNRDIVPTAIRQLLSTSSIIFIGYSLEDLNFRIIFRSIIEYLGQRFQLSSVAVLLPPDRETENGDQAQSYLERYARKMFNTKVYWGYADEFSVELRKRWNDSIR